MRAHTQRRVRLSICVCWEYIIKKEEKRHRGICWIECRLLVKRLNYRLLLSKPSFWVGRRLFCFCFSSVAFFVCSISSSRNYNNTPVVVEMQRNAGLFLLLTLPPPFYNQNRNCFIILIACSCVGKQMSSFFHFISLKCRLWLFSCSLLFYVVILA